MLKKSLIMASILMFASASVCFADTKAPCNCGKPQCNCAKQAPCNCQRPPKGPDFAKRHAEFEKRLKLTDKQKAKAEAIRKKGMEQMKPLMVKLQEKKGEIEGIKQSKLLERDKQAQIEQLQKEIMALKRGMHELRMQNMKEFEAILTSKQLKELKKMKEEGRKKFDKEFKNRPHPKFGEGFEPPKDGCHCPPPPFPPEAR